MNVKKQIANLIQANRDLPRSEIKKIATGAGFNAGTFSVVYGEWKRGIHEDPRIAVPRHSFETCKQAAKKHNETKDCVVKAFSVVMQRPYNTVHSMLAARGRVIGKGMYEKDYLPLLTDLGYELIDIQLSARTIKTGGRVLRERYHGHKALLWVIGHIAAFDGHRVQDWSSESHRRLTRVVLVVPPE